MASSSELPKAKDSGDCVISDFIDITIKTIDSKNFQFQVENDIQIKTFKERIAEKVGIDTESQRMIFCGRVLSDEKTLKEYKIDSGKTIHLVKKAAPAAAQSQSGTSGSTSGTSNSGAGPGRTSGFHSIRTDEGHLLMGTIALDNSPNNILNQMVRSLFTAPRASAANSNSSASAGGAGSSEGGVAGASEDGAAAATSGSSSDGIPTGPESIRPRIGYVRRFLSYIDNNFQILEHPNTFPRPTPAFPNQNEASDQSTSTVSAAEHGELFRQAFAVADRLRPLIAAQSEALAAATTAEEARRATANHSILMRISHHLSHVIHMLSEFNIDLSSSSPEGGVEGAARPLTLNTLDADNTAAVASAASAAASSLLASLPNLSARIEISAPTSASVGVGVGGGGLGSLSSIPGLQNLMAELTRSLGGQLDVRVNAATSTDEEDGPAGSAAAAASTATETSTTSTATTTTTSTSSGTSATATASEATTAPSATANASSAAAGAPASNSDNSGDQDHDHDHHHHHHHHLHQLNLNQLPMNLIFDPFLSCNSSYTIPEVRSATNIVGGGGGDHFMEDHLMGGEPDEADDGDDDEDSRDYGDGGESASAAAANDIAWRLGQAVAERLIEVTNSVLEAESAAESAATDEVQRMDTSSPSATTSLPVASGTTASASATTPAPARDEAIDALYDSEGEFADAISDFPSSGNSAASTSTSATATAAATAPKLTTPSVVVAAPPAVSSVAGSFAATSAGSAAGSAAADVPANWQAILPTEWIPVIEADIVRQRSSPNQQQVAESQQSAVFSDAYLNGMPKKRRLELKPEEEAAEQKANGGSDAKQQRIPL